MRPAAGRLFFPIALLLLLLLLTAGPGRAADTAAFDKGIRPLLRTYCISCHGAKKKRGGLDLARFSAGTQAVKDAEVWEQVAERVRAHEMPPAGRKEPDIEQRKVLVRWAESVGKGKARDCDRIASDRTFGFYRGHVMSRRLSRAEYNNSIRDLIGLDLRPADDFPADGSGGEGFDNNGDALFTSAIHVEKFLDAADRVVSIVLDHDAPGAKRFPPAAVAAARQRLLVSTPGPGVSPREAARRIVQQFAARAFRRPVDAAEVERFLTVFDRAQKRGSSFEASLKLPLEAILISPHFLFLVEPEPDKDGVFPLPDYPLASRLSYFLWATMPDDELLRLASVGKLQDDKVLRQQVRRMLRDPRSRGLAESFVVQWLGLGALGGTIRPDPDRFPEFDDVLAGAMRQEAIHLFDRIVREDRSLLELIDADYTFVNDRLAKLYGLEGVKGPQMRRVQLADRSRGGVLGLAGVLTVTSYPLRTSPVLRGKWVLEDLLGSKVPPPPPNAGELPRDDRNAQGLTVRQQLEIHRKKAECASCHQRMDPLGFGLESFDPIGRLRTKQAGQPIDVTGELPSGEKFTGPRELKAVLLKRKDEVVRNVSRKLLGYALGRQLYRTDLCVIDESLKALEKDGYRASILLERIVLSYPFRHRYVKK
jgi:mono/diheme cytochrome c family protein